MLSGPYYAKNYVGIIDSGLLHNMAQHNTVYWESFEVKIMFLLFLWICLQPQNFNYMKNALMFNYN